MKTLTRGLIIVLLLSIGTLVKGQQTESLPFVKEEYNSFQFCNSKAKLIISKETGSGSGG